MNVKVTLLSILICLWSHASAQELAGDIESPSFDCAKARGRIEKQICADAQLSALDKQAADLFAIALSHTSDQAGLRREQRRWARERNACREPACLTERLESRIRSLTTFTGRFPEAWVSPICSRLAIAETRNELLAQTRGSEDINNDGIAERVTGCAGGTANIPCVSYVDAQQRPVLIRPHGLSWSSAPLLGRAPFRFEDHTFIYYSRDAALTEPVHMAYVTPTNRELRLCEFETNAGSAVAAGGHDVCAAIESNTGIEPIEWTPATDTPLELTRERTQPVSVATVDVDNDRLDEVIVELKYDAGGTPGCTFNYFELLTNDRRSVLRGSKSLPLRELQGISADGYRGQDCGRIENRWFKFDEKIYYETNVTNAGGAPHEVRVLDGTAPATLCTFEREVTTSVRLVIPQ